MSEPMNDFKSKLFISWKQLQQQRISISDDQLQQFCQEKTLIQIESILKIDDQYILNYVVQQYLQCFIQYKSIINAEAYFVTKSGENLMYVYDCKIFRNNGYQREENDILSAFIIAYREQKQIQSQTHSNHKKQNQQYHFKSNISKSVHVQKQHQYTKDKFYQFLDVDQVIQEKNWVLKVKQSALLRIFAYLRNMKNIKKGVYMRQQSKFYPNNSHYFSQTLTNSSSSSLNYSSKFPFYKYEVNSHYPYTTNHYRSPSSSEMNEYVILPKSLYPVFLSNWIPQYATSIEMSLSYFFKGIMALLENQILLHFYNQLSQEEKYNRKFKQPIRVIEKPKNKEQFTSTTDMKHEYINWQSLKIQAFMVKYHVKEQQNCYLCFRIQYQNEEYEGINLEGLTQQGDENIIYAFQSLRQLNNLQY